MVVAPKNDVTVTNVPSGTCLEGLFPQLNLSDDERMNGAIEEMEVFKHMDPTQMFPASDNDGTAFALIAHGYV
jgi:hypothetical protein